MSVHPVLTHARARYLPVDSTAWTQPSPTQSMRDACPQCGVGDVRLRVCVCSGVSSRHVLAGRTDAVQTVSVGHVPGRLRSNAVSGVWAGHHDHPRRSHRLPPLRRQRSVTHSHQRCCCCCCGRWRFQRHRPLRGVDSVRLQILLMGTWFMVCPMARPHYHDMSLDWHRLFTAGPFPRTSGTPPDTRDSMSESSTHATFRSVQSFWHNSRL